MKIFLLGDSFTDNLFEIYYQVISDAKSIDKSPPEWFDRNEIVKYLMKLESINAPKALWFDDWLREFGYNVYNFGREGCTIEHIIYQFANLKTHKFNLGDRIILNWTHPSRFNWIMDNLNSQFVHSNTTELTDLPKKIFSEHAINRELSFFKNGYNNAYLNKNLLPFMEYIIDLHSKYKPIVWTTFSDVESSIEKQKWYFKMNQKFENITINQETSNVFKDGHFGQYGNYHIAVLFDEIIKSNIGPYYNNDSKILFDKVLNRIQLENKQFITTFN